MAHQTREEIFAVETEDGLFCRDCLPDDFKEEDIVKDFNDEDVYFCDKCKERIA